MSRAGAKREVVDDLLLPPSGNRRSRLPTQLAAALALVVLAAGIGVAVSVAGSRSHPSAVIPASELDRLSRTGTLAAAVDGDARPRSLSAVATDVGRAREYFPQARSMLFLDPRTRCFVIEATGSFQNNEPARLFGSTALGGEVLLLAVNVDGRVIAYSLQVESPLLQSLGTVEKLPAVLYKATSSTAAQLDQIAVDTAAWAGDPKVSSVTWVSSTWGGASSSLDESTPGAAEASLPVYVLEIGGDFQLNVSVPPGYNGPISCSALVFMVFQNDFSNAGRSCRASTVDLGVLGPTETDSLIGL